jgi:uncharacterized membrane protein
MDAVKRRAVLRAVLGALFIGAGVLHFVFPRFYLSMMPPWLPWHRELVYASGVFEVLGGIGLLIPRLRRVACWGLIALLVAVFPANVQYTLNALAAEGWSTGTILSVVRWPIQLLLIYLVWLADREA